MEKFSNFNEQTQKDILEARADQEAGILESYPAEEAIQVLEEMIK